MIRLGLIVAALVFTTSGCSSKARLAAAKQPLALDCIPLSCSHRNITATFAIDQAQWQAIRDLFQPPVETAGAERATIRRAVAMLEQIAGAQTPTFRDWRMDDVNPAGIGCMDCIDEAINTTTYLRLFEEQGLLRHHRVMEKAFRGPFSLDTHYAGQIQEMATGELYVVDSWFLANGWPPHVQKTRDWLARKRWPQEENSDTWDEAALDHNVAFWPRTE